MLMLALPTYVCMPCTIVQKPVLDRNFLCSHHAVHVILVGDAAAESDAPLALGRRQRLQLLADPVPRVLGIAKLFRALRSASDSELLCRACDSDSAANALTQT